ncbi:hypothetical protein GOP47_0015905 [Adiantum capillus-veneris]|uniref:Uncharacterized protein n=1 Tax=Adiantum capillus-veneris TaxID=13818 RepID=A0A9D4UKK0_ADICA|nr:hypothetical protein GOP47_0015905 [Adiantum capillus-veneris]
MLVEEIIEDDVLEEPKVDTEELETNELREIESQLPSLLRGVNSTGFLVVAFLEDDLLQRIDYITLDAKCVKIIKDWQRDINDRIILSSLRLWMNDYKLHVQQKVDMVDPTIPHYLSIDSDTRNRLSNIEFGTCELLVYPYHERNCYIDNHVWWVREKLIRYVVSGQIVLPIASKPPNGQRSQRKRPSTIEVKEDPLKRENAKKSKKEDNPKEVPKKEKKHVAPKMSPIKAQTHAKEDQKKPKVEEPKDEQKKPKEEQKKPKEIEPKEGKQT